MKNSMYLVAIATILGIAGLFFGEILFYIAVLILAAVYVNMVISSKKRMSEKAGKELSVFEYFRMDKSMLCLGLAVLCFGAKFVLRYMGHENLSEALHLMALAFIMLSIAFKNMNKNDDNKVIGS